MSNAIWFLVGVFAAALALVGPEVWRWLRDLGPEFPTWERGLEVSPITMLDPDESQFSTLLMLLGKGNPQVRVNWLEDELFPRYVRATVWWCDWRWEE